MIVQLVNKLMAFVVRTIFIKTLNTEYLGVNGLFTNILTILSFAELGFGTAIIFNMYKPIASNDESKIKGLMNLYKNVYNIIGIVVFLIGLLIIPFLSIIIKDAPNIEENLVVIYLLFLINTSSSYFFTYKKSIIIAHQKERIINAFDSIFYLAKSFVEILVLILFRNYIAFLFIQIVGTILENIAISYKTNKMYPYLNEKDVNKIDEATKKGIFDNVKSLVVYKLGSVIMDGTDNIIISSMVNVATVGLCSNYTLIINSVKSIISSSFNGVTASVGNLNAIGSKETKEKIFYQLTFINYFVYSICTIVLVVLINPFIELWIGKEYVMNISIPIALSVSFFINGLRNPGYVYRITLGLFKKGRYTPYIGALSNILLSIVLCQLYGVVGIFIATSIAQLLSYSWIDPYLIHKYEFNTPVTKYFKEFLKYITLFTILLAITYIVSNIVPCCNVISFILKGIISLTIPTIMNIIFFRKTENYQELKEKVISNLISKKQKGRS